MKKTINYKIEDEEFYLEDCIKDQITEEMLCQKCDILMSNPYTVDCDNHICYICEECLKILKKYPIDEEKISNKILRKNLLSKIQNLKTTCPYDNERCLWEDKLLKLKIHSMKCDYKKISCTNNCKELVNRKELEKHLKDYCMKRIINCPRCQEEIIYDDSIKHYENECNQIKIFFTNDSSKGEITREDFEEHLFNNPITFKFCSICNKEIEQSEFNKHIHENIIDHFSYLMNNLDQQKEEIETLKEEIIALNNYNKIQKNENKNLNDLNGELKNFENKFEKGEYKFLKSIDYYLDSLIIEIKNKNLDKEKIEEICLGIKYNKNLKELYIKNCKLGNNLYHLKLLMTAIKENNTIEILDLSYNNLGQDINNNEEIADLIMNDMKIKDLRLDNNNLGSKIQNLKILSTAIKENKYLKRLILTSNNLGGEHKKENINSLQDILKNNTRIKQIYFTNDNFSSYNDDIKPLLEGIKDHNKEIYFGEFPIKWNSNSNSESKIEILKSFANFLKDNFTEIKLVKGINSYGSKLRYLRYFHFMFKQGLYLRAISFTTTDEEIEKMKNNLIEMGFNFKFIE